MTYARSLDHRRTERLRLALVVGLLQPMLNSECSPQLNTARTFQYAWSVLLSDTQEPPNLACKKQNLTNVVHTC
jgi:hypothetical protein